MANRYAELMPAQKVSIDRRINALAAVGDTNEDGLNDNLIALLWEAKEAMLDGLNGWIEANKTFADEDRKEDANELFDLAWRAKDDLMRVAKEVGDRDRLMEESEEDR